MTKTQTTVDGKVTATMFAEGGIAVTADSYGLTIRAFGRDLPVLKDKVPTLIAILREHGLLPSPAVHG